MYLFAHFLHIQLFLLIAVLGCCSSSSIEVSSSAIQKAEVHVTQYEQYETAVMVHSRLDDPAGNIFMIGQSRKKGCKKIDCSQACPVRSDYKKDRKCLKKKKKMKKCCNKCHNSECQEPYRGQCDTFPMYIDRINKSRERARLQIARRTFSDAFGDTYSFQFTSRINATIYSYSLEVVDGNLMLTDEKQWCYPVNENENELKLCNILTVEDLFDIISIGIKNHPLADLYTNDQIVLQSVRYGHLGQPKSIVFEPISRSTSTSSCRTIVMRTRQFKFGRG